MVWLAAVFFLLGPALSSYSAHRCRAAEASVTGDCCSPGLDCGDMDASSTSSACSEAATSCCVDVNAYYNFPVFSERIQGSDFTQLKSVFAADLPALAPEPVQKALAVLKYFAPPPERAVKTSDYLSLTGVFRV